MDEYQQNVRLHYYTYLPKNLKEKTQNPNKEMKEGLINSADDSSLWTDVAYRSMFPYNERPNGRPSKCHLNPRVGFNE